MGINDEKKLRENEVSTFLRSEVKLKILSKCNCGLKSLRINDGKNYVKLKLQRFVEVEEDLVIEEITGKSLRFYCSFDQNLHF